VKRTSCQGARGLKRVAHGSCQVVGIAKRHRARSLGWQSSERRPDRSDSSHLKRIGLDDVPSGVGERRGSVAPAQ
jgi:hypothetical protein